MNVEIIIGIGVLMGGLIMGLGIIAAGETLLAIREHEAELKTKE